MKICPNCNRDFEDHVTVCRWCETELVSDTEPVTQAAEETVVADAFTGETVVVYTSYNPLQIADLETALKAENIPVIVRPSAEVTEETVNEVTEEVVEEITEEVTEEVTEEPEKKGFFARLFSKKKKEKKADDGYRFTRGGMMLDIVVPAEFQHEASRLISEALGIVAESDEWSYSDTDEFEDEHIDASFEDTDE